MTVTARDQIDLPMIQAALKRGLVTLLLAALTAGLACFVVLSLSPAKYTAQAQIAIVTPGQADAGAPLKPDSATIADHVRALQSSELALKMAAVFKLAMRPEFNAAIPADGLVETVLRTIGWSGPRAGESLDDLVLKAYRRALNVHGANDMGGITIAFTSADPALAADMANRLAAMYRESLAARAGGGSAETQAKLSQQIGTLAAEVQAAEAAVTRARDEIRRFDADAERAALRDPQIAGQIADLSAELAQAAAARGAAEARAATVRELARGGSTANLADARTFALIIRLVEQRERVESQIAGLSATLLPGHPRMRQLATERDSIAARIDAEVAKAVEGPDAEARAAAAREDDIRGRIDELKRHAAGTGGDEVRLRDLETLARSKRAELEGLQQAYDAARATADPKAAPVGVEIISRAVPSRERPSPRTGMLTLLAMMAVLLAGFAWIVLRAMITSVRTARTRTSPTLASYTAAAARAAAAASGPRADPGHAVVAMHDLARRIQSDGLGRTGMRTLLTGVSADLSPDDEAVELAGQLARGGGSVILLAWDVGPPSGAPPLAAWAPPGPGLSELLTGEASFEDVVRRLPDSAAHVISAGALSGIQAKTLNTDRVCLVLDALDDVYDHILIVCRRAGARMLFNMLQGRLDVAVEVVAAGEEAMQGEDLAGVFADRIDVLRLHRTPRPVAARPRRPRPAQPDLMASA